MDGIMEPIHWSKDSDKLKRPEEAIYSDKIEEVTCGICKGNYKQNRLEFKIQLFSILGCLIIFFMLLWYKI